MIGLNSGLDEILELPEADKSFEKKKKSKHVDLTNFKHITKKSIFDYECVDTTDEIDLQLSKEIRMLKMFFPYDHIPILHKLCKGRYLWVIKRFSARLNKQGRIQIKTVNKWFPLFSFIDSNIKFVKLKSARLNDAKEA